MKKIILTMALSFVLVTNVQESKAQIEILGQAFGLFQSVTKSLSSDDIALAQQLYTLVHNSVCLRKQFTFYMSFILNNNDCAFNINEQNVIQQYDNLYNNLGKAATSSYDLLKNIWTNTTSGTSSTSSSTFSSQIAQQLKQMNSAIIDLNNLVVKLNASIRKAYDDQMFIQVKSNFSGQEISQNQTSVL